MNIRALPSWRQKEGAHTEILLYEMEQREEPQNDAKSVSKDSNSKVLLLGRDVEHQRCIAFV